MKGFELKFGDLSPGKVLEKSLKLGSVFVQSLGNLFTHLQAIKFMLYGMYVDP